MIIRTMTATFGKLDRAELRLEDGLNILQLPNEGGKSTWSAFLLAMLYGIDTSERAAKGTLPAKTRFKPWSGAAMEGRMEILWNGRAITIERRSKGRIPMGEFRAYETESGLPVKELTAENCGLQLLGVEKAVFERSAFLRQSGIKIDQIGALEQRLGALVTSGDETVSYSDTEKRLRDWKNAVRHNRTGELPRLEREAEDTDKTLRQIHALLSSTVALRAREEQRQAELSRLTHIEKALQTAEQKKQQERLRQAEQESREKQAKAALALQAVSSLPEPAVLQQWQQEWASIQQERRSLPAPILTEAKQPVIPTVFAGKTTAQIDEQVYADCLSYDAYAKAAQPMKHSPPWISILAAVLALILFLLPAWYLGFVPLIFAGITLLVHLKSRAAGERQRKNAELAAHELLRSYQAADRDAILRMAETAKTELSRYEQESRQLMQNRQYQQTLTAAVQKKEAEYLMKVQSALPDASQEPLAAIQHAMTLHQTARQAQWEAREAIRYHTALAETIPPMDDAVIPADFAAERYDAAAVHQQIALVRRDLQEIRSRLDRCQGQISAMGDPAVLEARKEQLAAQIAEKQTQYEALSLAMEVLGTANNALQTQFAPEISRRAAEIMNKLTGGRYDKVMLDQNLAISARETGEVVSRDLIALSQGTADQLYLAVRLAICETALSEDTPLVLDDALVNFDDTRAAQALALLREEAKRRQILLFTCQNREKIQLETM